MHIQGNLSPSSGHHLDEDPYEGEASWVGDMHLGLPERSRCERDWTGAWGWQRRTVEAGRRPGQILSATCHGVSRDRLSKIRARGTAGPLTPNPDDEAEGYSGEPAYEGQGQGLRGPCLFLLLVGGGGVACEGPWNLPFSSQGGLSGDPAWGV